MADEAQRAWLLHMAELEDEAGGFPGTTGRLTILSSTPPMQKYIERVRDAMQLTDAEIKLPRSEYIAALEELASDIEMMLSAAKEEQKNEEEELA